MDLSPEPAELDPGDSDTLAETVRRRRAATEISAGSAAEHRGASLYVWEGDDGPRIRPAMATIGIPCIALAR